MKRIAMLMLLSVLIFASCDTTKPTPEPEPDEYFSFYADGEFFDYPQIKDSDIFGDYQTLVAKKGGTEYMIRGSGKENPKGMIALYFPGAHIPESDTVIITSAGLQDFKDFANNYEVEPPLNGKVIFTERSLDRVSGTFEFDAYHINYDGSGGSVVTDTIIKITGGKFSIIPTN